MSGGVERLEQILERGALRRPDKTAAVCGKAELTYGELDLASNALARDLLGAGVTPGDRVGLYLAKGVCSLAALYGVLKTGAAYVPLDPTGPLARSLHIMEACGMEVLVVGLPQLRKLAVSGQDLGSVGIRRVVVLNEKDVPPDVVPSLPGVQVELLSLPRAVAAAVELSPAPAGLTGTDQDTAYILFTSGSTGTPKGVTISHRASLFFVKWAAAYVGLESTDRCSNHAPLFFDLSIFDVYSTMLAGATVVIVPPAYSAFPRSLANYVEQQQISVWYSVPSTLMDLEQTGELGTRDFSSLRTIIFAGEVYPMGHLRQLMEMLPGCEYYNLYGPTETNVCTAYKLPGVPAAEAREIPIGQVCEGLWGALLGEDGQPMETPGEGELIISGPAVMQGYWDMPQETAQVMLQLEERACYRTGDLVREDEDGQLYFVGRKDSMVKISGYRVELGEVEAALDSMPQVLEGCAVASTVAGKTHMEVFAVPAPGHELDPAAVTEGLLTRLPKYMMPQRITVQGRLPRTATGKVNRKALVDLASRDKDPT